MKVWFVNFGDESTICATKEDAFAYIEMLSKGLGTEIEYDFDEEDDSYILFYEKWPDGVSCEYSIESVPVWSRN